jgi:hypothetical protein
MGPRERGVRICARAGICGSPGYITYPVRLSVHEDVTPRGVNPPLQLLLPLNLTIVGNRQVCAFAREQATLAADDVRERKAVRTASQAAELVEETGVDPVR